MNLLRTLFPALLVSFLICPICGCPSGTTADEENAEAEEETVQTASESPIPEGTERIEGYKDFELGSEFDTAWLPKGYSKDGASGWWGLPSHQKYEKLGREYEEFRFTAPYPALEEAELDAMYVLKMLDGELEGIEILVDFGSSRDGNNNEEIAQSLGRDKPWLFEQAGVLYEKLKTEFYDKHVRTDDTPADETAPEQTQGDAILAIIDPSFGSGLLGTWIHIGHTPAYGQVYIYIESAEYRQYEIDLAMDTGGTQSSG